MNILNRKNAIAGPDLFFAKNNAQRQRLAAFYLAPVLHFLFIYRQHRRQPVVVLDR